MNALTSLQESMGLKADGIFGKNTLKSAAHHLNLTDIRAAHFFGQIAHETGNFKIFTENLNYSKERLLTIFGKYFDEATAEKYQRNPEMIANKVYANRMGNGDEGSGDGWRYRGRGAIQLTGKDNYEKFFEWKKQVATPDDVSDTFAFDSAIFFFERNKLWDVCDRGLTDDTIISLTRRINGGTHGLDDRKSKTLTFYTWLTD